ncbi:MAG TPA: leucine-rich repeat domain-containing protein [Acidobacteriota bacterium]|nr:leucine-rich repeat domain-containing protein [Acidobacteriota bacterium]
MPTLEFRVNTQPSRSSRLRGEFFSILLGLLALLLRLSSSAQADSVLNFPRLSFEQNTFTGIALVNPSGQSAVVTFTAYGADGNLLAGSGFHNPAQITVPPNQQIARLMPEIFGGALPASSIGWTQATSPVDGLVGFFLYLDGSGTFFDGADLPDSSARIIFNQVRVDSGYTTELDLINLDGNDVNVQLELVESSSLPVRKSILIPASAVARLDAAGFFAVTAAPAGSYLAVTADGEIAGFEFVKSPAGDLLGLNARVDGEQLANLFFPQMAVLGSWKTELGLVNYALSPAIITVSAYKPDGSLYGTEDLKNNPEVRSLDGGASLREDVATMFGFSGPNVLDGWIKVESTSAAVNGYVSYGTGKSVAAVAPAPVGLKRAIFSHLATSAGFFNGVAVLNPSTLAANVRILAIQPGGLVLGSYDTVLQPGQRLSKLITELIPPAAGQGGGVIWVKSDNPVYLTELFGTANTLANVPPQPAPDSYNPDTALSFLRLVPSLAPVQVGSSQIFQVQNGSGPFNWKVNGIPGGNSSVGTISATGLYKAPAAVPSPQVLTITAEAASQVTGASLDVLQKETLVAGLGQVQSVAYLGSLKKLYSAELAAVSASQPSAQTTNSNIFEVPSTGPKVPVSSFGNEVIAKMIPYRAADSKEYLLLAGQASGRIIRLNPGTKESINVVTGLNQPTAMVLAPATGDLLVAEADKISVVSKNLLETGITTKDGAREEAYWAAPVPSDPSPRAATLSPASGATGIAVDGCTGDVYFSESRTGLIRKRIRRTGQIVTVASGLNNHGHLLGIHRSGVSCPFSLHLLVIERGLDRILMVVPGESLTTPWIPAQAATDLIFLPKGSPLSNTDGVLISEATSQLSSQLSVVKTPNVHKSEATTLPIREKCLGDIVFADLNLEAAVRSELKIGPQNMINCEMAGSLKSLDARNKGISNLSGLESFSNLRKLMLEDNAIRDIRPLSALTCLSYLSLGSYPSSKASNFISDLGPLAGLTTLTLLKVTSNSVSDVRPLSRLSNLIYLGLSGNSVSDLSPLSKLTKLLRLHLSENRVTDVTPLAGLTGLTTLWLDSNSISDIGPLSRLTDLTELVLIANRISDIRPLSALMRLSTLNLSKNQVSDVTPLSRLTGLVELRLLNNSINDLRSLSTLNRLSTLDLQNNLISDITPLAGLTSLVTLDLSSNGVSDIRPLVANLGLGRGDFVDLKFNSLTAASCPDLKTLVNRGVAVGFSPQKSGSLTCP